MERFLLYDGYIVGRYHTPLLGRSQREAPSPSSRQELEALALRVRRSEQDRKWEELRSLLLDAQPMFDAHGQRHKLVLFTEHRDTLTYLVGRISTLLGQPDAVVTIHGGLGREERRTIQERFMQDKGVHILVATDAATAGTSSPASRSAGVYASSRSRDGCRAHVQ
jgi:superfamily II DNA/RNA helicase